MIQYSEKGKRIFSKIEETKNETFCIEIDKIINNELDTKDKNTIKSKLNKYKNNFIKSLYC